jgi:membrane fusion protein (multidrug efflux system)
MALRMRLALALGLSLAACSGGAQPTSKQRPPPLVTVEKVVVRDVPVEVKAPVDLRPLAQADLAAKTAGFLDAVLVDRGDAVKKGQLVALVRPSELPDQLAVAKGQLAQAQASKGLAETNDKRIKGLAAQGLGSQAEADNAAGALATSSAAEAAAKANLDVVATRLGETRIVAPFDGVVVARKLDPGGVVGTMAGGVILTVARTEVLRVFVAVREREAASVAVGQKAHVELDALPGKRFEGAVVRLAPAFDAATRTLDAEVQLPNAEGALRPGMYGRGAIVLQIHPKAIVVPAIAVQITRQARSVYVLGPENKVKRVPVTLGVDGGEWLEVTSGLSPGDEVVVAGIDALADGAVVRPFRAGAASSGASSSGPSAPGASAFPAAGASASAASSGKP